MSINPVCGYTPTMEFHVYEKYEQEALRLTQQTDHSLKYLKFP